MRVCINWTRNATCGMRLYSWDKNIHAQPGPHALSKAKVAQLGEPRGGVWGNRGAGSGGTARGGLHCPAPLSKESKSPLGRA